MASCYSCEKKSVMGRSQKHRRGVAGKRWMYRTFSTPRVFVPNLQNYTILEAGKKKKVVLCAKCIKRIKFDAKREFASV